MSHLNLEVLDQVVESLDVDLQDARRSHLVAAVLAQDFGDVKTLHLVEDGVPLSSPSGKTRLKIEGIEENTVLKKLGLENGDTLELVDGEIIEYSEQSSLYLRRLAKDALDKLRNGEAVSITVTRKRVPIQMIFSLQ